MSARVLVALPRLSGICCGVETSFLFAPKCQLPSATHLFGSYLIGIVKVSYVIGLKMFHSLRAWIHSQNNKRASGPFTKCQINDKTFISSKAD